MDTNKTFQMESLADHGENLKILYPHPLVARFIDTVVAVHSPLLGDNTVAVCYAGIVSDRMIIAANRIYDKLTAAA